MTKWSNAQKDVISTEMVPVGGAECDEAEASGAPGGGVLHHHHLRHIPKLGKVFPNIL
jgi:hypothetical protein